MKYRASAVLPYAHRERAVAGLRGQLRVMAVAGGTTPDWTTLAVEGPTMAPSLRGRTWFEWAATVEADGEDVTQVPVHGAEPTARPIMETQPFAAV